MQGPLKQLFTEAHLQHEGLQKYVRYLKASEALAAFWASNLAAHYLLASRTEPKLEREVRALGAPSFGTFVSILRIGAKLDWVEAPAFRAYIGVVHSVGGNPDLRAALELARKLAEFPPLPKDAGMIDLLETLMVLRNRGLGHGGIPAVETVSAVERLCTALDPDITNVRLPKMLSVQEIKTDPDKPGEFVQLGHFFDGRDDHPWRQPAKAENLLPVKQLHFFDADGPISATPFIQINRGTLWFLQKYRRGGNCVYTDYRSETQKTDPYWDEYLSRFLEERFERGGQVAVQVSPTGVYHDLPAENDTYKKFVGRKAEVEVLKARLRPQLQIPIVAIGGLGGVGKTALARSFVETIASAPELDRSFDYLVWVSAKSTVLQETVESVTPGFEDIDDVLDEVARVAESPDIIYQRPFEKKKASVMDLLSSGRFLLVIDNFETVRKKDAFWDFLLEIPAPSKVLVTSRETFSEGCWTLGLKELTGSEALEIFSNECESLGVDAGPILSNEKERGALLQSTGGIPLALKHMAILLQRGKRINEALQGLDPSRGPIAEFCFRATFNSLDKVEKNVWIAMGIFGRPVSHSEIVHITELNDSEVSRALQALRKYTIINRDSDRDGYEVFWCLPLTLGFARSQIDSWPGAAEMAHRHGQLRALIRRAGIAEPAARVIKEAGVSHPKLLARELSRAAQAQYRTGKVEEAVELVESAIRLAPKEARVWEAKAEIERGEFQYQAAFDAYQKLIELSPHNISALREIRSLAKTLELWETATEYARRATLLPASTKTDWHILGHTYYKRAAVQHQRGDRRKEEELLFDAIDCFKTALVNRPSTSSERKHNATVCDTLARAYMRVDMLDEALETVINGLVEDPYNSMLLDLQLQLSDRAGR